MSVVKTAGAAAKPQRKPWVFITWYPYCRRSDALAEQLGASSYLIHYLRFKVPYLAPAKYILQSIRTLQVLIRERPTLVLVANPPVVAPLVIWLGSKILQFRFVIDAHSGAFQHARWNWSLPLQRFLARRAVVTLVTNEFMASIIRSWGARAQLIQDLAFDLVPQGPAESFEAFHVVFICTYSLDEPVEAVVEAARRLPHVRFSFTGDPSYAPRNFRESLPPNVRLTGFIPDDEYLRLLRGANAILVLTREDHTMQRGAYEAMALEKPLITSDWQLLRQVFCRGTIHVDNSVSAIAEAIEGIQQDPRPYCREMANLKHQRSLVSASQVQKLRNLCQMSVGGEEL